MSCLTRNLVIGVSLLSGMFLLSSPTRVWAQYVVSDANAAWQPVMIKDIRLGNVNNVKVDSSEAFWYPRMIAVRDHGIDFGWYFVQGSILDAQSATLPNHPFVGFNLDYFDQANYAKLFEAASYIYCQWPTQGDNPISHDDQMPERHVTGFGTLENHLNTTADIMRAAQLSYGARKPEHSGFICVRTMNRDPNVQPPPGESTASLSPWNNRYGQEDGYVVGYMMAAGCAHYMATGGTNTKMLNIAKDAGLEMHNWFVAGDRPGFDGNSNTEQTLHELYRLTGDTRYRDVSERFLAQRGHGANGVIEGTWVGYFQDDMPIEQQTAINGHAGRAVGVYAAMANAVLMGRSDWYNPLFRVWRNDIKRKVYVTGIVGSWDSPDLGEGFSRSDYDLVNEWNGYGTGSGCYTESCACCDQAALAWRMARLKGDGESVDEMERSLYNGVMHGISADAENIYYQNPQTDEGHVRGWNWVCCTPNLLRNIAGIGRYIYGRKNNDLWINLFIASDSTIPLTNGNVPVSMRTNSYPWDGRVTITVTPATPTNFTMHIRMPGWCRNALLRVNGKAIVHPTVTNQYIVINRTWSNNDQVVFTMAMPPMRVEAHPSVAADTGRVCIQRGPIIFALEGVDNGGGGLADPTISATPNLQASYNPSLLGGVEVVTANKQGGGTLTFVPWYATAMRGISWQRIWVNQQSKTVRSAGWNDRLYREYTP